MKPLFLSAACLMAVMAEAADYVWTGASDADFAKASNWSVGGSAPASPPANDDTAAGDVVILPEALTANHPVLSANWNLKELRFTGAGWTFSTGAFTNKVGRYGNGVATANASGTNTFSGNLRLGSVDTPGPGWDVAAGGVLRVDGTVGRYAQTSGGGAIRKRGGGTLELNTGASTLNGLNVDGGAVRIIAGVGTLDANKSLTVNTGVYDLNGNSISIMSLNGTANGTVTNGADTFATLSTGFGGSSAVPQLLAGALHLSWGHNGTPRTLTFPHGGNTYAGRTTVNSGITAILRAASPRSAPGVFGVSQEPVTIGTPTSAGGGTVGRVAAILTDGPFEVGKPITIGTDKGRHLLGTTLSQADTSTFSGDVMVGLGAAYNGDNPHLEIQAGTNACVHFTGNITNALGTSAVNYALRSGKVLMLGPGQARLTGDNAHLGGTVVSNGVLIGASTNALGLGGVTVAGGVLGGTYTVTGAVSVLAGATLTAGETNTAGTATLQGGLALSAGSTLAFQISGDLSDRLLVPGGTIAVTAPVTVDVGLLAETTAAEHTLLDWSGAASGSPQLSDFTLGEGAGDFLLVLRDRTLVARRRSAQGTVIRVL